jgi:hypothetical protein
VFDDHRQAALSAAGAMRHATALEAHLLPDGHVAVPGADPDPAGTWQILGCTPHEGCVVRAEVAGACWVTRIEAGVVFFLRTGCPWRLLSWLHLACALLCLRYLRLAA